MKSKTKKTIIASEKIATLTAQIGILLMSAATTFGMLELPDHTKGQIAMPNNPVLTFAGENVNNEKPNPINRETEETEPYYISYSVSQRTPARSGKS